MAARDGPTLAERSGRCVPQPPQTQRPSAAEPAGAGPEAADPARTRPVGQRHCWVTGLPAAPGRYAGVVVAWRALPGEGWCGRTVYVVDDRADGVVVDAWVPAQYLQPA